MSDDVLLTPPSDQARYLLLTGRRSPTRNRDYLLREDTRYDETPGNGSPVSMIRDFSNSNANPVVSRSILSSTVPSLTSSSYRGANHAACYRFKTKRQCQARTACLDYPGIRKKGATLKDTVSEDETRSSRGEIVCDA